ncbi:MAG: diacylglycerol kinase family lipid kinase [Thermodesulfobacteriota bacterium]|nr:diacylglycerol kinase family lipid kinase [Thermodesulfobacteriota bacterium]
MRVRLIVNPVSGKYKAKQCLPLIEKSIRRNGISYDLCMSRYPGHIEEIARESVQSGYSIIVVCGGDGTVNEAINGMVGSQAILSIIPVGTGNDLARNMGITEGLDYALSILKNGVIKKMDLIKVNNQRYFSSVGCVGFDSEVASFANSNKNKKHLSPTLVYAIGIFATLLSYKEKMITINFGDDNLSKEIFLTAFGNTRLYGRGMKITPCAQYDDGIMEICVIEKVSRLKVMILFPLIYRGGHTNLREVNFFRAKRVDVSSQEPIALFGDGEFICNTPFTLEVDPLALNILSPPDP